MKKKKILAIIITMVTTTLVGCSSMPELTEEESNKVASYLASVVLDYHSATKSRVLAVSLDEEDLEEEDLDEEDLEEEVLEEELGSEAGGSNEAVQDEVIPQYTNLADILPMNGVTLMLEEYQVMSQFQASDGLGIYAKDGNQIVMVNYQMLNSTVEAKELDFFSESMTASLSVNGEIGIRNMITIFSGDMIMFNETIDVGEQISGFIMFEVPSTLLANISTLQMEVRVGANKATINLAGNTNYNPLEGEGLVTPDMELPEEGELDDNHPVGEGLITPDMELPEEGELDDNSQEQEDDSMADDTSIEDLSESEES